MSWIFKMVYSIKVFVHEKNINEYGKPKNIYL